MRNPVLSILFKNPAWLNFRFWQQVPVTDSQAARLPGSQAPRLTGAPWQHVWEVRTLGASWHPRAWVEGDGVIRGAAAARAGEA
jgi:hypothetical protein